MLSKTLPMAFTVIFIVFQMKKCLKTSVKNVDYISHYETELNLTVQKDLFWTDVMRDKINSLFYVM
jgi:hypothetical protein